MLRGNVIELKHLLQARGHSVEKAIAARACFQRVNTAGIVVTDTQRRAGISLQSV